MDLGSGVIVVPEALGQGQGEEVMGNGCILEGVCIPVIGPAGL